MTQNNESSTPPSGTGNNNPAAAKTDTTSGKVAASKKKQQQKKGNNTSAKKKQAPTSPKCTFKGLASGTSSMKNMVIADGNGNKAGQFCVFQKNLAGLAAEAAAYGLDSAILDLVAKERTDFIKPKESQNAHSTLTPVLDVDGVNHIHPTCAGMGWYWTTIMVSGCIICKAQGHEKPHRCCINTGTRCPSGNVNQTEDQH